MVKLAPSILSADFANLGRDIKAIEKFSADIIHIDVMDGSFVPNISFGFPVIKSIREVTKLTFDVHLMIENPTKYAKEFVDVGADIITIHYEAERHIDRAIAYIKSLGVKVGVALNPGTPVNVLDHLLKELDMVLIMSVNPGFGGQKFIEYSVDKIRHIKELSEKVNKDLLIEVDGGIDTSTAKKVVEAGANVLVAGSAVFKDNKLEENIKRLKGSWK